MPRAHLLRIVGPAALGAAVALSVTPPAPAAAATGAAASVIRIATNQVGDPYRYGTAGPSSFDCSGLVLYSFRNAGKYSVVGSGRYRSARALYYWFRSRGLASRSNGRPGDIVVWGGGTHVGIYLGNGKAVSALVRGVRIHSIYAVTSPFTAFLHTHLSSSAVSAIRAAATSGTRVTTGRLNFRTGPGTSYGIRTVLAAGTRVAVLATAHDRYGRTWYKVRTLGRIGWVAGWYTRR
jgi:cell wall-associated NlpC family hydrolase